MKILLLLLILFSSATLAEDKYETNVPDVYIKNAECNKNGFAFNLVNKSDKTVRLISLHIFDKDGDPIDIKTLGAGINGILAYDGSINIPPQTGKGLNIWLDCKALKKFGFSVGY
jgi:hypothetical protein